MPKRKRMKRAVKSRVVINAVISPEEEIREVDLDAEPELPIPDTEDYRRGIQDERRRMEVAVRRVYQESQTGSIMDPDDKWYFDLLVECGVKP
jgi:hypothetical protein